MSLLHEAGLTPVIFAARDVEVGVDAWLELAQTPARDAEQIRRDLRAELAGGEQTGLRPFRRGDDLMFRQQWLIAVVTKSA